MRTLDEASRAVESYSPAEEAFNRKRRTWGLFLGPLIFGLMWLAPLPVPGPAHRLAAILAMVVVLWISEALPMAVTAMLGPILAVVFRVAPARGALAPFADPIIFLFIGSFILAEAMFVHGLDRRIAFTALASRWVGTSGTRILVVYGLVGTCISMWMSNTATTAMMFPIGLSIVAQLRRGSAGQEEALRKFATVMMLITSFGASVGGMATPVGTPPNLIGIGLIERITGTHIGFFRWMAIGVPLVLILFTILATFFVLTSTRGVHVGEAGARIVREELDRLGPMNKAQRNVCVAFGATVLLWTFPGVLAIAGLSNTSLAKAYLTSVPEGVAAMLGAMLLFVLPVHWAARKFTITWEEAARIDWGIVLLYGGGLAMGDLAFSTGLATAMGHGLTSWLPGAGPMLLTTVFTGAAILLSETTSNTASANMVVPVAIAVATASKVDPMLPALGATLGASMGFMMPISTAPNAIVYSSGHVPISAMIRYGIVLDLAGFVVIVALLGLLGPLLF
ncbi:SLC13 family permease [Luteitalea pratensis]|uniref:SLC13 family permease n=1 Tax=Luteitalea pratensis TaxID=1855912 RepID=UPI001F34C5B6|nr:DASS family sodium-coupled anion symporter [Luteitalea pratensis]